MTYMKKEDIINYLKETAEGIKHTPMWLTLIEGFIKALDDIPTYDWVACKDEEAPLGERVLIKGVRGGMFVATRIKGHKHLFLATGRIIDATQWMHIPE